MNSGLTIAEDIRFFSFPSVLSLELICGIRVIRGF